MTTDYFRAHSISQPVSIIDDVAPFANGIGVDKSFLNANLVQAAHARKLSVGVWTVDTEAEMIKFMTMGVDGITTNRPDLVKRLLEK